MVTQVLMARATRVTGAAHIFAVLGLATLNAPVRAAAPAGDFSARWPANFVVAENAQRLRINGLDVRSRALSSSLAPDAACALLERQWRAAGAWALVGRCERAGDWFVITHPSGNVLETAQLRASAHGSVGFVSTVDPSAGPAARTQTRLPLPVGTRVLNIAQSIEPGDSVTQFTLLLPFPLATALLALRTAATDRGWRSVHAKDSSVIDFQHGAVTARAVATPAPTGTAVLLVEHESSGLLR
jgi:hypothetical protein